MIDHYNAFISYRHAEKDSAIAAEVQHRLERYKLPRAIQKRTGKTKLGRVFRDKEELPITSDLNDDISFALEHSDFLIVICSVRTKESVWVEREIRYFLKTHSKKQVLTVLVDGEPYDVIPELLLTDEVEVLREDGTTETVTEAIEPLSCDYRIPIRRARREELPRLAAALLGCSYDELVERERQYRRHRIITIASCAGVLLAIAISYLVWSLLQIRENYELAQRNYEMAQENYDLAQSNYELAQSNYQEAMENLEQSQRNQSVNLANQSLSLLNNNNRIDAIHLALAALPGEGNERPLVAEAEYALAQAVSAYVIPGTSNIACAWNYEAGATLEDYKVSSQYLLALDNSDLIYCWDINTHELLWKESFEDAIDIALTEEGRAMVLTRNAMCCADAASGEILWKTEAEERLTRSRIQKRESGYYVMDTLGILRQLDPETGEVLAEWTIPEELLEQEECSVSDFRVSPGETKAMLVCYNHGGGYRVGVLDLVKGTVSLEGKIREYISDICVPDEEKLVLGEYHDVMGGTTAMGSYLFISESTVDVVCLNSNNLKTLWSNALKTSQLANASDMFSMDYTGVDGTTETSLIYYLGEKVEIYRVSDGKVRESYSTSDPVVKVIKTVDGGISILTESGQMGSLMESNGTAGVGFIRYFCDDLNQALISKGAYVHQRGASEIIFYAAEVYDEDVKNFDGMDPVQYLQNVKTAGKYAVVWDDDNDAVRLQIVDAVEKKRVYQNTVPDVTRAGAITFLGEYQGKVLFAYVVSEDYLDRDLILLKIDPVSGTEEKVKVMEGVSGYAQETCALKDGVLFFVGSPEYGVYDLYHYDIDTGESTGHQIPAESSFLSTDGTYVSESGKSVFLEMDGDSVWYQSGSDRMIRPEMDGAIISEYLEAEAIASDDSALALSDNMSLAVFDTDGKLKWKLDLMGTGVLSLYAHDGILYAALTDETLRGYRIEDGSQLGTADVYDMSSRLGKNDWYMDEEAGQLYVTLGHMTTVVDTGRWMDTCVVPLSRGYNPEADIFLVPLDTEDGLDSLGWFKHYTVEDLREKAGRFLGDSVLTDEKKMKYGLE